MQEIKKINLSLEFKTIKISHFVDDMKNGGTPRRNVSKYWENGTIPWLKTGEINNSPILDNSEYITEEGLKKSSAKVLPINSVIMALYGKGTAGRVGLLKFEATTNQACCAMICKDRIKSEYLYYYLLSIQPQIELLANGSVQQNLSKEILADYDINVPKNYQDLKNIVWILKNIDQKIENNKSINKNLEELMHVLFKKYFIDNNPFYVENDEKWNIIKLKDLIIRNRDKINDFDNWKDELLIDLSNMPRFSIAISNFDKGKKFTSNIYKLNKYDLLFGSIRPYFGKVGFSPINGVVTGTVHSFKPIDDIYYSLVLSLISSKTFINYTVSVSKGTKMPSVKWDDFINYEFAIPDDLSKIGEYNKILLPLIHKIEKNILEIQRLTKLRDTLLPKLMSGEIDVSKINCDLE